MGRAKARRISVRLARNWSAAEDNFSHDERTKRHASRSVCYFNPLKHVRPSSSSLDKIERARYTNRSLFRSGNNFMQISEGQLLEIQKQKGERKNILKLILLSQNTFNERYYTLKFTPSSNIVVKIM